MTFMEAQIPDSDERLDLDRAITLYESADLWHLGRLAENRTLSRYGCQVYYSVNLHINYTNVCRFQCRFCGFSRRPSQSGGYVLTVDEVVFQARAAQKNGASEVHIVGGVHPELPFEYYKDILTKIRQACPNMHIKAFTAVEIIDIAEKYGESIENTLKELMAAGLGAMPGGGAEILDEQYFQRVCPNKPGPDKWLTVHATAHQLGLMTNATMLYGYQETIADRIRHLLRLRDLQDESIRQNKGKFLCFVPLPYIPPKRKTGKEYAVDAVTEMKTIAISRLVLDNFDYIKSFWPMLGVKSAQIALCFGANDLDGTVQQYSIVDKGHNDNADDYLSVEAIRELVTEVGRVPVQRDGLYRVMSGEKEFRIQNSEDRREENTKI